MKRPFGRELITLLRGYIYIYTFPKTNHGTYDLPLKLEIVTFLRTFFSAVIRPRFSLNEAVLNHYIRGIRWRAMTLRHIPLEDAPDPSPTPSVSEFLSFWGFGEVWGTFPGYVGKIIENLVLSISWIIFGHVSLAQKNGWFNSRQPHILSFLGFNSFVFFFFRIVPVPWDSSPLTCTTILESQYF